MHESQRYTNHLLILNRLTRPIRESGKAILEQDVIEWCQEIETEICPNADHMFRYIGFELEVEGNKCIIPCNAWRILDVYTDSQNNVSRIAGNNVGKWYVFSPHLKLTKVYMDFVGTAFDEEDGYPLILKGHEQACYWYCMYNIFLNEFLGGRMNGVAWNEIKQNKENEIIACQSSSVRHKTRQDLNNLQKIQFNAIPVPARMRLIGNMFKGSNVIQI